MNRRVRRQSSFPLGRSRNSGNPKVLIYLEFPKRTFNQAKTAGLAARTFTSALVKIASTSFYSQFASIEGLWRLFNGCSKDLLSAAVQLQKRRFDHVPIVCLVWLGFCF